MLLKLSTSWTSFILSIHAANADSWTSKGWSSSPSPDPKRRATSISRTSMMRPQFRAWRCPALSTGVRYNFKSIAEGFSAKKSIISSGTSPKSMASYRSWSQPARTVRPGQSESSPRQRGAKSLSPRDSCRCSTASSRWASSTASAIRTWASMPWGSLARQRPLSLFLALR